MKRCCLLILVAAMYIATALAQDEDVLRPHGRADDGTPPADGPRQSTRFIIGPELGMNLNLFSSTITGGADRSPINAFSSGLGVSVFAGLYVEVGINRHFGIGARMLYDMKTFGNTMDSALIDCTIPLTGGIINGFTATTVPIQVKYNQSISYFTLNPLLRWSPSEEVIVHLGPVIQFAISNVTGTITRTIAESELCRFNLGQANESNVDIITVDDTASVTTRFGLDVGVGYRLALAPSIALVPRIGYQFMFSPVGEDAQGADSSQQLSSGTSPAYTQTNLKLTSLQASIALWFTL